MSNLLSLYRLFHSKYISPKRAYVIKDTILNLLPKDEIYDGWLDVGTGDGEIMCQIYKSADIKITGVQTLDIRESFQSLFPHAVYDGKRIPFPANSFYLVSLTDVLHHTNDITSLLTEAKRVAKKYVLIKDVIYEKQWQLISLKAQDWFGNIGTGCPLLYNFLKEKEWQEIFDLAGLKILKLQYSLNFKYPFPFNISNPSHLHFVCLLETTKSDLGLQEGSNSA